jgi:L-rhamnose mutarotase
MQRICWNLKVKQDRIEEYKEAHRNVWPEMLKALRSTGWHNYSLFLRDDGTLIGYLETEDFDAALERMSKLDVNRRWQEAMSSLFEQLEGGTPDSSFVILEEVFHLD